MKFYLPETLEHLSYEAIKDRLRWLEVGKKIIIEKEEE